MFYLSKTSVPTPADAPYAAHLNEQKEWAYHQKRHQEALHNIRGQLDSSQPKSINPAAQSIQAHSRRFAVDARNAEIGRENRKLVDKLTTIAKSSGQCAPPGQLSGYGSGPQPGSLGGGCTMRLPPKPPVAPGGPGGAGASQRSRSLNDNQRRKVQQQTNQDNASMVRRILSVKSTFSPQMDEKNFQRHTRDSKNLQRMPEGGRKNPRSLPPLNRRPNSYPMPARGLEAFLMPSDLTRSQSGPGAVGRQALLDGGVGPRADSAHATTAPAGSLPDPDTFDRPPRGAATEGGPGMLGSQTYSFGGFDTYDSLSGEATQSQSTSAARVESSAAASGLAEPGSQGASAREGTPVSASGVSQNAMPRPAVGPGPEEEAGSAARGASAFGKRDSETERRQWTQGEDNKEPGIGISAAPAVGITAAPADGKEDSKVTRNNSRMGMTGLSNVSDLQYADDWDEDSFSNMDASKSAAPSRGPSTSALGGTTGQPLREPSGLQPVLEPSEDVPPVSKLGPLASASLAGGVGLQPATASPATGSASPLAPLASASLAGNIPIKAAASPATASASPLAPLAEASLAGNIPTTGSAVAASSSAGAVDDDFSKPPDFGAKKPGRRPR